jgi:hypothetical protein
VAVDDVVGAVELIDIYRWDVSSARRQVRVEAGPAFSLAQAERAEIRIEVDRLGWRCRTRDPRDGDLLVASRGPAPRTTGPEQIIK